MFPKKVYDIDDVVWVIDYGAQEPIQVTVEKVYCERARDYSVYSYEVKSSKGSIWYASAKNVFANKKEAQKIIEREAKE